MKKQNNTHSINGYTIRQSAEHRNDWVVFKGKEVVFVSQWGLHTAQQYARVNK